MYLVNNELKQLKRFILTICKEGGTECRLFSDDVLVNFLDSFDSGIKELQGEIDFREKQEDYSTKKSTIKLLNKWKALSKEAHAFLNKTYTKKYLSSIGYKRMEKLLKSKLIQKYK